MGNPKAVIIAISGASSSGKTTLSRLLRDIFPNTFLLHEDDFYKPEDQLPVRHGLVDWDCPEAISVADMEEALAHIRTTGTFPVSSPASSFPPRSDHGCVVTPASPAPLSSRSTLQENSALTISLSSQPDLDSKEDKNTVGQCPASDQKIVQMKEKVRAWLAPGQPGDLIFNKGDLKVCLLDGFLLYCEQMASVMATIDVKLFLLVSKAKATQRREVRDGYVTLEGFWQDPPGYVDKIVWPNYSDAHAWLFEDGNVEGKLRVDALEKAGIQSQVDKGLDVDFDVTLEWAVNTIIQDLEKISKDGKA